MWNKIKSLTLNAKLLLFAGAAFVVLATTSSVAITANSGSKNTAQICDGKVITENCQDENGTKYSKYVYHEAIKEVTKTINHPAEPAKNHVVHHDAVYGTRQVQTCIKATIGSYAGQCARCQCADGAYSGATGRGSCSHHGGVAAYGPFYTTTTEQYVVTPAWDEVVGDELAKEAWSETVVVTPARDAYIEKQVLK